MQRLARQNATVAVETNLMSGIYNHLALDRECLETVSGDEPCRSDVILLEELQHPAHTDGSCKQSSRDVAGGVFAAI